MAEPENLQQKNRVIYNVQDLFFGLVSGEYNNPYVSGYNGEEVEVLKRIHRVQSVSYDFQVKRQDVGVLGRAAFEENIITEPPDINLTITHSLEGFNNERKMGFNVLTFDAFTNVDKEFSSPFLSGNVQQNIYLAVNQNESDIHETVRDPFEISELIGSGRYEEIAHVDTDSMGLIVFQNCRATSYDVDISVGSLPKADVSFVSDNAIYLNSASGQHVPWINTQTAKTYYKQNNKGTNTEFIVPGNYARVNPNFDPNYTFKPGDCHLTVATRPSAEDTLLDFDFEDGGKLEDYKGNQSNDSSVSCLGNRSLKVVCGATADGVSGGVRIDLPDDRMQEDEYYTIDAYLRCNSAAKITVLFSFQDGGGVQSNLSTFKSLDQTEGCVRVQKRVKLDKVKKHCYIYTSSPNVTFWIDSILLTKDAENPPLKFHTNLMQSFKLSVPLARENISCVGYKYYEDRPVSLPVKTSFSIDMTSQDKEFPVEVEGEDRQGNFMDNLTKDEEYDMYLTFTDNNLATGMRYRIFGAKFEGVNYGLDVGSPKTTSLNFSISNDYDFERDIITAEGKGLFVLDFLVNDSLVNLTDDQGNYLADPFPHLF